MRSRSSPQNATRISAQVAKLSNSTIASSMIDSSLPYRAPRGAVSWDDTHLPAIPSPASYGQSRTRTIRGEKPAAQHAQTCAVIWTPLITLRIYPRWGKRHSGAATQVRCLPRAWEALAFKARTLWLWDLTKNADLAG